MHDKREEKREQELGEETSGKRARTEDGRDKRERERERESERARERESERARERESERARERERQRGADGLVDGKHSIGRLVSGIGGRPSNMQNTVAKKPANHPEAYDLREDLKGVLGYRLSKDLELGVQGSGI